MRLLYDILPVFLFFLAFKYYDIYVATIVGMLATGLQVVINRIVLGQWDKKQLLTLGVFILFGSMTLYFHNPIFIKWKPTLVFWIFAIIIFITHFTHKPLMQRLMENMMQDKMLLPHAVWKKLNNIWAIFFILLGAINLYIAYRFSDVVWVNFKFYGITAALLLLSIFQAIYLMRYTAVGKHKNEHEE